MATVPANPPADAVSVDAASGPIEDNGYLANARTFLNCGADAVHSDVRAALRHLEVFSAHATRDVHLVGHGATGAISAGTGQVMNDDQRYLGFYSRKVWETAVTASVVRMPQRKLTLWSCHTGAGTGAEFAWELARKLGARVAVLNGDLVCDRVTGFSLYGDAQWFDVDFAASKAPVIPHAKKIAPPAVGANVVVWANGQFVAIHANDVSTVSTEPTPLAAGFALLVERVREAFGGGQAQEARDTLLRLFDLTRPVRLDGAPSGRQTGRLLMALPGGQSRIFLVYNQSLLWDRDNGVYYRATTLLDQPEFAGPRMPARQSF